MFRSASTLQFQITSHLVKEAGIGDPVGWIDWKRFHEVKNAYVGQTRLKIVKVHVCCDAIAQEFKQNNAKGIYIYRDIRDVCASYLKQRQKPFEFLWNEGFVETCLDGYQDWTSLPNVLVSKYDAVMSDLTQEVKRIAQHLDINVSDPQAERIASEYQLEPQRQRIELFKTQLLQTASLGQKGDDLGVSAEADRDIVDYYDQESLLHINHIRSGKIGQWEQELSPDQAARIEAKVTEWCANTGFDPAIFLSGEAS